MLLKIVEFGGAVEDPIFGRRGAVVTDQVNI